MTRVRRAFAVLAGTTLLALVPATTAMAAAPGSLDTTFGSGGSVALPSGTQAYGVAVEPGGNIVVAGGDGGNVFAELLSSSGAVLKQYTGPAGLAEAVAVAPDGDVVLAGQSNGAMLVQDLSSGLTSVKWTDLEFAGQDAFATSVAVTSTSGAVVGGEASNQTAVAEFTSSGALSWTQSGFGDGTNGSQINGVAIQPNGDVVAVGEQRTLRFTNALIAQLSSGGVLHAALVGYQDSGYTILTSAAAEPDGSVVAGGATDQPYAVAVRMTETGSIDSSFGTAQPSGGYVAAIPAGQNVSVEDFPFGAYGIGLGGGGTILAAGNFENTGAASDQALYAFTSAGQPDSSLTGGTGTTSPGPGTVVGPDGTYEACGIAVDPSTGNVLTAGDGVIDFPVENPCGLDHTAASNASGGFVSRLIGLGAPPIVPPGPPSGSSPPPKKTHAKPVVTTGGAGAITKTSASVAGTVNPEGLATTYFFQYGTSTSYGSQTTGQQAGSGTTASNVAAVLSGLAPGRTYHYRLVAGNADGTSYGADQTFTTAKASPPKLKVSLGKLSKKYSDATVEADGIKLKVTCNESCSFTATLTISKAAAEKAKLGSKAITLGTVSSSGSAHHAKTVTLKLSRSGARYLAKHTVAAVVYVRATHAGSRASTHAGLTLTG